MDARVDLGIDSALATEAVGLIAPPYLLSRPERLSTPLVFASPHSGRLYPAELMAASVLDAAEIRRSEDAYIDTLLAPAGALGIPLIAAQYARAYMDVNREPYELDPNMFEDDLPAFANARTARVAAGLGSIARVVAEGREIYGRKLTFNEAKHRIEHIHSPYHAALRGLIDEAKAQFGVAILIDWHSMPSAAAGTRPSAAPDMVLGDRFGVSCARIVTDAWERALEAQGYRVARNAPYAGGHTTEFYGEPRRGVHALQIEINRGIYLDEPTVTPHTGFPPLQAGLTAAVAALQRTDWSRLK